MRASTKLIIFGKAIYLENYRTLSIVNDKASVNSHHVVKLDEQKIVTQLRPVLLS